MVTDLSTLQLTEQLTGQLAGQQTGSVAPFSPAKRPILLYTNAATLPDAAAQAKLVQLAKVPALDHYVVALPDIHAKARNPTPTGTVVVSRQHLLPAAIDKGINCGMRVILSELQADDLTTTDLDQIFAGLAQAIPGEPWPKSRLTADEIMAILLRGGQWATERYPLAANELQHIERGASVFEHGAHPPDVDARRLRACVPPEVFKKGGEVLGTLGGGNHFLEMQKVVEILDGEKAQRLGIRQGQVVFMLHTGSRHVGSTIMRYYTGHAMPDEWPRWWKSTRRKLKFHLQRRAIRQWGAQRTYFPAKTALHTLVANSPEGQRLLTALHAGYNFGFVNRIAITAALRQVLRDRLAMPTLALPLLYDCAHVSLQQEAHLGELLWVHRHGASQALPPSALVDHPTFAQTGQPVPIPGSMGDDSYIGVAAEGVAQTFHSVNHGAGRVLDKPDAQAHFAESDVAATLAAQQIRLYRTGSGNLAEQAPRSFKPITAVVEAMQQHQLATLVARTRPIAVLKG
jgi:tRNA-splicing ligase RtcB